MIVSDEEKGKWKETDVVYCIRLIKWNALIEWLIEWMIDWLALGSSPYGPDAPTPY
jgi:hypothetical protein